VIDERSAAFFALGRARADKRPVAFLCTSGSAAAHALPALLEARYAGHRLLAISADRPPELHDCGANQTIDQRHLFAAACPPCLDLGMPQDSETARLAMRRRVHQALVCASGPLHINIPFRKALEPTLAEVQATKAGPPLASVHAPKHLAAESVVQEIAERCAGAERGLIIAGASVDSAPAVQALAEASGFVLLAESTSGARFTGKSHPQRCDAFPHIASAALQGGKLADELRPQLIVQVGREPASASLNRWLSEQECPKIRLSDKAPMRDVEGTSELVLAELADTCSRLALAIGSKAPPDFLASWRAADEEAWARVAAHIDHGADTLSEARAVAVIMRTLPAGCRLTLGNSMPVRATDLVLPGHQAGLEILHQRGTSGIDGLIAGAIGSSDTKSSALLIGDVSFSHDLASLALAKLCRGSLAIIVIDNQGGQIFSHLPIADAPLAQGHQSLWRTPPSVSIDEICRGFGVGYKEADTVETLEAALQWSLRQDSCHVLHVRVPPESMLGFVKRMSEARDP
jgi:2-succinyl-5-enolpyruvyl-6-hydroxy-3-cyclohexene-1-carboxylate synthase